MSASSVPANTNLKGKRKRKIPPNANPLFTQWLTEWKQEAVEKGWKSAHTYAKALKTIKLFPLPLSSGKDCRLLQNFGDKICKMLDERLMEYKHSQGISAVNHCDNPDTISEPVKANHPLPSNVHTVNNYRKISRDIAEKDKVLEKDNVLLVTSSTSSCKARSHVTDRGSDSIALSLQTRFSAVSNAPQSCQTGTTAASALVNGVKRSKTFGLHELSDSNDSVTDLEVLNPPQKKKPRGASGHGRNYVPAYRSGPYALILALYRYMQDNEFKGYLTKSELSHAAQPFCDKSFLVPDAGSRYTAWSSMGTLIKKGFFVKTNSPARYSLTDDGYQLGERLYTAEMQSSNTDDISRQRSSNVDSSNLAGLSLQPELQVRSRERKNSGNLSILKTSEAINFLDLQNTSSDSEDDDMSRKITESILSLSQKESVETSAPFLPTSTAGNRYCTSTEQRTCIVTKPGQSRILSDSLPESSSSSSINNADDEGIFIVSDEDDDDNNTAPVPAARTWAQYHSLSPSLSSPPKKHHLRPLSQKPSFLREAVSQTSASPNNSININVGHLHMDINSTSKVSPQFTHSTSPQCQGDVLEISDDDSNESISEICSRYNKAIIHKNICANEIVAKEYKDITYNNYNENGEITNEVVGKVCGGVTNNSHGSDDDDELPDLDLPLSKRLLQKGHAESGLLRSLTSSLVPQSSIAMNEVNVIDKQTAYKDHPERHLNKFTSLKTNPVCLSENITYNPDAVTSATESSITSQPYTVSNSSGSVYNSNSTKISNIKDSINPDKAGFFQKNIKAPKIVQDCNVNLKQFQSSASYVPQSSETASVMKPCPAFSLQPGFFDIILCLDNREFYGSKGSSKTLLPELMKHGILCDLRLLHVGDLLWIARERVEHQAERSRELVLHYIIERKRMDDLVSSMTDGRLKEQKFRLKHCGLSETIILIEEYGSIQNFSISEDRIKQSIVNSQIIDGFKVKRCESAKDAVTYLVTMTNFLKQYYTTKTLHAVSLDHVKLLKGQQTLHQPEHYLIPFDVFNEASVKHKDLTVKEMFAKQLIQVPGVSADRARAITNVYPTFSVLMAAFEGCANDKEKQKLLSGIKCGKKERNLGIALSNLLCMLYTQKGSLS